MEADKKTLCLEETGEANTETFEKTK